MSEPKEPDQTITWRAYVLATDAICVSAGIPVPHGAEIDVDVIDRTSIRFTVKAIEQWRPGAFEGDK